MRILIIVADWLTYIKDRLLRLNEANMHVSGSKKLSHKLVLIPKHVVYFDVQHVSEKVQCRNHNVKQHHYNVMNVSGMLNQTVL